MFTRAFETTLICSYLERCVEDQRDDLITYQELSTAAGIPVNGSTFQLRTARKHIEDEHKVLFASLPGEGIVITRGDQQADVAAKAHSKMRRHVRHSLRRMGNVRFEELSDGAKRQHNLDASILGVVEMATRSKTVRKIQGVVPIDPAPLPVAETIKLFLGE